MNTSFAELALGATLIMIVVIVGMIVLGVGGGASC